MSVTDGGSHYSMRMTTAVSPDVSPVTLMVLGGFRDWPVKAINERDIADCSLALFFLRCGPAPKRVALHQMKKCGIAGLGRLLFLPNGGVGVNHVMWGPDEWLPSANTDRSGDAFFHQRLIHQLARLSQSDSNISAF